MATRLNSVAVHLIRAMRRLDTVGAHMAPEHRSALAVIVFGGPIRMSDLAERERLSAPAITRTVGILERQKLVRRVADRKDGRAQLVAPTAAGTRMVMRGVDERVRSISTGLGRLSPDATRRIGAAIGDLEHLAGILREDEVALSERQRRSAAAPRTIRQPTGHAPRLAGNGRR